MPSDYFAPLIAILFFVSATLAGIYLYCCYFRTSKEDNDQNKSTDKAHRGHEEERNVGILTTNFYHNMYPLSMSLPSRDLYGNVNIGFTSSPLNTPSVLEEKTAKVLVFPFEEKTLKEPARDRPLFCRSTSHDAKRVSSHCQLQVIQEVNEEEILDEEEGKVGE